MNAASLFVILCLETTLTSACNGVSINLKYARNCQSSSNHVIKLLNTSSLFTPACEATTSTCLEINPFSSAKMKMTVKKDRMTLHESSVDLCDKRKKPEMIAFAIIALALPTKCGIKEKYISCRNDFKISFSPTMIKFFGGFAVFAARDTIITFELQHDNGVSCIELQTEITKE